MPEAHDDASDDFGRAAVSPERGRAVAVGNEFTHVNGRVKQPPSLTELFHRINQILPAHQKVMTIPPEMTVQDAFTAMRRHRFSQVPVVDEQGVVLGLFSYRSFALESLSVRVGRQTLGQMPVQDFVETVESHRFARVTDEMDCLFDRLDRDDAVLVGDHNRLQGIITAIDVLKYLYGVSSPFVLVAEIELGLRALIHQAADRDQISKCVANSLRQYKPEERPTELEDMAFNDYIQIVGDDRNWLTFQPVLSGTRERTRARLNSVREVRNDVFHFRRAITLEEHETLTACRDWILAKSRAADRRGARHQEHD